MSSNRLNFRGSCVLKYVCHMQIHKYICLYMLQLHLHLIIMPLQVNEL